MDYFDNHCDTLAHLLDSGEMLQNATGQVSLKQAVPLRRWAQVFALFVDDTLTGEEKSPYLRYLALRDTLKAQLKTYPQKLLHCRTAADLDAALGDGRCAVIASVENGSLLEGRIERLAQLQVDGIKLLTLTWYGENQLGFASKLGGHLKPFGKEVVRTLVQYGITPDISHLSDEGADDVFTLYEGPIVASHSCARGVTPHFRNVSDAQLTEIVRRGGLIGLNFFGPFLRAPEQGEAGLEDIYRHIAYFLERGAQDVLCFGSDFDGVGTQLPREISSIAGIPRLRGYLEKRGLDAPLLQKIFFENAYRFWHTALGM